MRLLRASNSQVHTVYSSIGRNRDVEAYLERFCLNSEKLCFMFWDAVQEFLGDQDFAKCERNVLVLLNGVYASTKMTESFVNFLRRNGSQPKSAKFFRFVSHVLDVLRKNIEKALGQERQCTSSSALQKVWKELLVYLFFHRASDLLASSTGNSEEKMSLRRNVFECFEIFSPRYGLCEFDLVSACDHVYEKISQSSLLAMMSPEWHRIKAVFDSFCRE